MSGDRIASLIDMCTNEQVSGVPHATGATCVSADNQLESHTASQASSHADSQASKADRQADSRQISVASLMAYAGLWAVILGIFRLIINLHQGVYTIAEAQLTDVLMLFAAGLTFAAIALPITVLVGRVKRALPVAFFFFLVGFFALPILVGLLFTLAIFGLIDLD